MEANNFRLSEINKELAKRECEFFIENCVKIEDRDSPEIAVFFNLWDEQKKALKDIIKSAWSIILKARQLGLTWLVLSYATWKMIFNAGFSVVALSKREDDAKELTRRIDFILRYLPESWGVKWDYATLTIVIYHENNEPSTFKSLSAAPNSGRSLTGNLLIIDEWAFQQWARDIWSAAFPTINRPTGGQVIGISTGRIGTLFEEIWNSAVSGANKFKAIFLPWWSDPRRDQKWYEETKAALPNTYRSEYPATPEEAFTVGDEAFFLEWNEKIHAPFEREWYPPKHWKIIRVYDPGFGSRACMKWYAISPDGWAVCYREYYPQRVIDEDQAEEIIRLSKRLDGTPEVIAYTVSGVDAWNKNKQTSISTANIFSRKGIPMRKANTDLENGWRRLHRWLKIETDSQNQPMALLRFTKSCVNTLRTYPALRINETNPETVDDGQEDHPQDCDRYFAMSRPEPDKVKEKDALEVAADKAKQEGNTMQYEVIQRVLEIERKNKRKARNVGDIL